MAVYITKVENPYMKPDHEIDVRQKNSEWICNNIKFMYGRYIAGECGITPQDCEDIALLRSYMDGKQPHEQYKERYLNDSKDKRKNEYGHIKWSAVLSPMPKIIDKIQGLFISQEHDCAATCTTEYARQYKVKDLAHKKARIKLQESQKLLNTLIGLNPDKDMTLDPTFSYVSRDIEEAEMIATSGSYKLPFEIGSEKLLEYTKKVSYYDELKRNGVRDLALGYFALREDIDTTRDILRWKNVDITDMIIEYDKDTHFRNSKYAGIQELWQVSDLRKKGYSEEECRKMANTYFQFNMAYRGLSQQNRAFNFYDTYYKGSNTYGYDDFLIPVIYGTFKSVDTKYKKKVKTKAGDYREYDTKFGSTGKNVTTFSMEKIYEGRWIMGTNHIFDDGVMAYMPRDAVGNVRLPFHITKLKGASLIERLRFTLDEFAMLGYKLQNALAKSQGKQYEFDLSSLEGMTKNTGGKVEPADLIDAFFQGSSIVSRSIPLDEEIKYPRPPAVKEIAGGIGTYLNELLILKNHYTNEIAELTGITTSETPTTDMAVGLVKLAIANMTDVMKPLYGAMLETKEMISYNSVYRAQLLLNNSERARKTYESAIGRYYVDALMQASDREPLEMGISFEARPTEEMKQEVIAWARNATSGGRNGEPIMLGSEYLYLIDRINTQSGLKEARLILQYREKKDAAMAKRKAEELAAQQAQIVQAQQQAKVEGKVAEIGAQSQANMTEEAQKKDLELRNQKELQGDKTASEAINKGIDYGLQQQAQQEPQPQEV